MLLQQRRWFVVGALLIGLGLCLLTMRFLFTELDLWSTSYDDDTIRATALQQADQLLTVIRTHANQPLPDDLPGYLRVNDDCWAFLQEGMRHNTNTYTLAIADYFNSHHDPKTVHELVEVWIHIRFPDGRVGELLASQGGLTGCRAIQQRLEP
jgi:hypothetical protein